MGFIVGFHGLCLKGFNKLFCLWVVFFWVVFFPIEGFNGFLKWDVLWYFPFLFGSIFGDLKLHNWAKCRYLVLKLTPQKKERICRGWAFLLNRGRTTPAPTKGPKHVLGTSEAHLLKAASSGSPWLLEPGKSKSDQNIMITKKN